MKSLFMSFLILTSLTASAENDTTTGVAAYFPLKLSGAMDTYYLKRIQSILPAGTYVEQTENGNCEVKVSDVNTDGKNGALVVMNSTWKQSGQVEFASQVNEFSILIGESSNLKLDLYLAQIPHFILMNGSMNQLQVYAYADGSFRIQLYDYNKNDSSAGNACHVRLVN